MFDREILEALSDDVRLAVSAAILLLDDTGLIDSQIQTNRERILHGPDDEPVASLAERILENRRRNAALVELQNLADQLRRNQP